MKLLYASGSPYSAKVRMAAHYNGLAFDAVTTDTKAEGSDLTGSNPLGKIPTLVTDDGKAVFDSRVIMQHIDRTTGKTLYPRNTAKRTDVEVFESLCDGICDALVVIIYERRFRPDEKVHQEWIDRQWRKVERGLDYLNANLPRTTKTLHAGHFALAALLGYLAFRFDGQWERGRAKLKNWPAKFEAMYPDYAVLKPQG